MTPKDLIQYNQIKFIFDDDIECVSDASKPVSYAVDASLKNSKSHFDDLSYFDHIHPHLDNADGTFAITTIFPEGGKYKLWIDATPKGGSRCLAAFYIYVHG